VGRSGGFTTSDSRTNYYLVNDGQLRKDMTQLNQAPPPDVSGFNFHFMLPDNNYAKVSDLPASIPVELINLNHNTIGSSFPDATYLDVRASINGVIYDWRIEANVDGMHWTIQQFAQRLEEDILSL
jgi:hypothetical protein